MVSGPFLMKEQGVNIDISTRLSILPNTAVLVKKNIDFIALNDKSASIKWHLLFLFFHAKEF